MHKETFEITQNLDHSVKNPDNYFAIDESIALPIQVLNHKGYTTEFCCCGYAFNQLCEGLPSEQLAAGAPIWDKLVESDNFYVKKKFPDNADEYNFFHLKEDRFSYIMFKEGIILPTLPPGFVIINPPPEPDKRLIIEKHYQDSDNAYHILRDILETMEQLYEWTLKLPNFKY